MKHRDLLKANGIDDIGHIIFDKKNGTIYVNDVPIMGIVSEGPELTGLDAFDFMRLNIGIFADEVRVVDDYVPAHRLVLMPNLEGMKPQPDTGSLEDAGVVVVNHNTED